MYNKQNIILFIVTIYYIYTFNNYKSAIKP